MTRCARRVQLDKTKTKLEEEKNKKIQSTHKYNGPGSIEVSNEHILHVVQDMARRNPPLGSEQACLRTGEPVILGIPREARECHVC
jgi:hypothetical protein